MNWIARSLLTFSLFCFAQGLWAQKGYDIKVKLKDYKNDTCILGYRLGDKTYVKDTAIGRNAQGYFEFKKDTLLEKGVYLILTKPSNSYFEFLVPSDEEQTLSLETKDEGGNWVKNLKIKGSKDNMAFVNYLHFLSEQAEKNRNLQSRLQELQKELDEMQGQGPKKAKLQAEKEELEQKMKKLNGEVTAYQEKMIKEQPNYLSTKLILASRQPEVPQAIAGDRLQSYYYFKKHYWDDFDFGDMRLIRTPVFQQKLDFYCDKLTVQDPDSVIVSIDFILGNIIKAGDKDMYQFAAAHLLNRYANSKVICMDNVYYHIGSKYYCGAEKPDWVEPEQLEKICANVEDLRYSLCGEKAQDIKLTNIKTGLPVSLYGLKKRFVAVYFWDPSCGNCSKNSKKLVPVYEKWKDKGFEIYGICSKNIEDVDACKKKIKELGMNWINTSDKAYPLALTKKLYNVKVNPFVYLLDQEKNILYKRLDPEQIDQILTRAAEEEAKEKG